MKCLATALMIVCLAGCSQEQWNYAEAPQPEETVVQVQPPIEPVQVPTEPVEPTPNPAEVVEPPVEPVTPTPQPPVEVPEPPVTPTPQPTPVEPTPPDPNVSPAEIIARKLVSDNPEENLEVLNDALAQWIAEKGVLPEKIGDLVAGELLPMLPMAPQGKVFSIDRETKMVILVAKD